MTSFDIIFPKVVNSQVLGVRTSIFGFLGVGKKKLGCGTMEIKGKDMCGGKEQWFSNSGTLVC